MRPTYLEVNLAQLKENVQAIRAHVAPARVMPMVKANAYGHGAVAVSRQALAAGDWAGTAQMGHPGVTTMWLGSLGILAKRSADPAASTAALQWLSQITVLSPENAEAFKRLGVFLTFARLPVILVNETSGRTSTVLSEPDGSFLGSIAADVDDSLSAVFVNQNGTRNTVSVSRQIFRDGSVGLFHGGGVIEAAGENGGVRSSPASSTDPAQTDPRRAEQRSGGRAERPWGSLSGAWKARN